MEIGAEQYRDQIENWKETVCETTFGAKQEKVQANERQDPHQK